MMKTSKDIDKRSLKGHCSLCGKKLDVEGDDDSVDCGGDCLGCIKEFEEDCNYTWEELSGDYDRMYGDSKK